MKPMTVKELIEKLQKCDPDMKVYYNYFGYASQCEQSEETWVKKDQRYLDTDRVLIDERLVIGKAPEELAHAGYEKVFLVTS